MTSASGKREQKLDKLDIRAELISGDPTRQNRALLAVMGLLAAGREVSFHISFVCHTILGSPNVAPAVKVTAYDIIQAASPSDADIERLAAALVADLKKGTVPELRVKALQVLPTLPAHHLLSIFRDEDGRRRLHAALQNPATPVRVAAIECLAAIATANAIPAAAIHDTGIATLLSEIPTAAASGLTDKDGGLVIASCRALTALLHADVIAPATSASAGRGAHEASLAAVTRANLCQDSLSVLEAVFGIALARFRTLGTGLQPDVPPLLTAYLRALRAASGQRPLEALPGELAIVAPTHVFEEVAELLGEYLRTADPPVVLAAVEALFELAHMDAASSALQAMLPSAIAAAVGSVNATAEHHRAVVQQAVLEVLLRHLQILPSVQQAALFPRIAPMVADMPVGAERVRALFQLWSAAASYDWGAAAATVTAAGAGGGGGGGGLRHTGPTASQLQQLLLEPAIRNAISGAPPNDATLTSSSPVVDGPRSPTSVTNDRSAQHRDAVFREELVGTLLYVLLTHRRPAGVTASGGPAAASSSVVAASVIQSAAQAVDWLESARAALQGTKACLGWDRAAGIGSTGTTAVADMWLQLLLRCVQVRRGLVDCVGGEKNTPEMTGLENVDQQQMEGEGEGASPPHIAPNPATAALAALSRRSAELDADLQGLMLQIATNWRALHPAVRPRAVWLCACHLRLQSVVDASWTSLADALRGLTLAAHQTGAGERNYVATIGEGRLRLADGAENAMGRHLAAVTAGASEAEEVALMAMERLASLVSANHRDKLEGELSAVAGLLEQLASLQAGDLAPSPSAAARLARLQLMLKPISTAGRRNQSRSEAQQQAVSLGPGGVKGKNVGEHDQKARNSSTPAPVIAELSTTDAFGPSATSYPSTLPSAAALSSTPEVARHRKFMEQLQRAALETSITNARAPGFSNFEILGAVGVRDTHAAGLPTMAQLAAILDSTEDGFSVSGGGSTESSQEQQVHRGGTEVTGAAAPVSLNLSHIIDPVAGLVRLRCVAVNQTLQPLAGVEVTLLAGGPIAGNRRPLTYRLRELPPGESTDWEVQLRVAGFGWPVIQPGVTLPVHLPAGSPSLRCRPYGISPLQLLAPPARALSPVEFYQRWQALPHRACIAAMPVVPGPLGVQRLLAAVETAGLTCVMKAVVPGGGGVHAAFHGSAWSGESIAVVMTSGRAHGATGAPILQLHFGSEAAEVISHIRGRESEVLQQLAGSLATPAGGLEAQHAAAIEAAVATTTEKQVPEERPLSTFSFLRSVTLQQMDTGTSQGEQEDVTAQEALAKKETRALQGAALRQWQQLHVLRSVA